MLDLKIKQAFKEWAVIVDALGRGEQTIVLRKGGLQDPVSGWKPEHKEFFLFPTYEHQNEEDLVPQAKFKLHEMLNLNSPGTVIPIQFFAVLEDRWKVTNIETLLKLEGFHEWSESAVRKKLFWGEEHFVNVLLLRVFKLPEVFELPFKDVYSGCKSWINVEEDIPFGQATAVLSDRDFEKEVSRIKAVLNP